MIQAATTKPIEQKASVKAKGKTAEDAEVEDPETMVEGEDFANELMASLSAEEKTLKVKPVKVSPDQLIAPELEADAVGPKVFDPALTKDVDNIIQPQTTEAGTPVPLTDEQILKLAQGQADPAISAEVKGELSQAMLKTPQIQMGQADPAISAEVKGELSQAMLKTPQIQMGQADSAISAEVKGELSQAMLKTPQIQTGRAPAVDMAKAEIDPQLVNMEDFVAQKNLAVKKSLNNASPYGMTNKAAGKAGTDTGLNSTQTVNELSSKESSTSGSSMNSQQFILNAQADLGANAKVNEAAATKTFNMSNIKSENPNQIMTQISDYIVQAKAAKEPTVNMRVNHDELGIIDITVNKLGTAGQDAIAITIATHSVDGKNFFQTNSKDLFSHLTNTGLNVSDLKVEMPNQTAKNDFDFGSQSGRSGAGQERQFGSEQNQKRHDSDRRQDLWKLFQDKEAA